MREGLNVFAQWEKTSELGRIYKYINVESANRSWKHVVLLVSYQINVSQCYCKSKINPVKWSSDSQSRGQALPNGFEALAEGPSKPNTFLYPYFLNYILQ